MLRADSLLAVLVGKSDLTGAQRERERDRGHPLAGSSTLNRLELSTPESAGRDRYKKIAADPQALDSVLVDVFMASYAKPPREIWLDLDATDDPLHERVFDFVGDASGHRAERGHLFGVNEPVLRLGQQPHRFFQNVVDLLQRAVRAVLESVAAVVEEGHQAQEDDPADEAPEPEALDLALATEQFDLLLLLFGAVCR